MLRRCDAHRRRGQQLRRDKGVSRVTDGIRTRACWGHIPALHLPSSSHRLHLAMVTSYVQEQDQMLHRAIHNVSAIITLLGLIGGECLAYKSGHPWGLVLIAAFLATVGALFSVGGRETASILDEVEDLVSAFRSGESKPSKPAAEPDKPEEPC